MKKTCVVVYAVIFVLLAFYGSTGACTSILVTKGASSDGSIMVTHEADGELGDTRFVYVPAADHKPGAKRPVYPYHLYYPRYVGSDRGPGYVNPALPSSRPLGYIPQVAHTYAYIDSIFGVMNEHQLHIGEVTCGARVEARAEEKQAYFLYHRAFTGGIGTLPDSQRSGYSNG